MNNFCSLSVFLIWCKLKFRQQNENVILNDDLHHHRNHHLEDESDDGRGYSWISSVEDHNGNDNDEDFTQWTESSYFRRAHIHTHAIRHENKARCQRTLKDEDVH